MVACWSRRSSGRGNISYRQYQPLRGKDDDPSTHRSERGSVHGEYAETVSQGPGRLSMEMSLHGSSRHSTNSQASSQHGVSRSSRSSNAFDGSQHGDMQSNGTVGDGEVEWVWSDILNPLTRSFHGMSDRNSSHSQSPHEITDADADSDSDDSDDSADGFQVAPADVGHESGTWLRAF